MDDIVLRPTLLSDLEFVLAAEQHPDNAPYINQWSMEQHRSAIASKNDAHLIVEANAAKDLAGQPIGYVILVGLENPHLSLLLKRIVILPKGQGFGRMTLRWIKAFTFEQLSHHRLELDVIASNQRAQHLYRSEGFVDEGRARAAFKTSTGYEDLLLLAILKDDYLSAKGAQANQVRD